MSDYFEHSERAEIEGRDPATTAVLERINIPDHGPEFWDELTVHLNRDEPATVIHPRRFAQRSTHRVLLAAAVILILLFGGSIFAALPDGGGGQAVNAGPTGDVDAGPETDDNSPVSQAQIGGADAEWFFSNQLVWTGDEFIAGSSPGSGQSVSAHWTSTDGIDWNRRAEAHPALIEPFVCPAGYRCEVAPTVEPIPFHFAQPQYEVLARAGETLLLRASVIYTIDGQDLMAEGQETGPGPELHPGLLAAAAATDPCFAHIQDRGQPDGLGADRAAPYLSEWGSGGLDDPVIRMTCRQGETIAASFILDLRDHLTAEQIEKVYSFGLDTELWVERPGEAAVRVVDAPSADYWADGVPGGTIVQQVADITSSGNRYWAASDGVVVTSTDGVVWTPVEVPTGDLEPTRIEAAPGGNLALRLSTDSRDWSNDRWISISHDDGTTWSSPFEVPAEIGSLSFNTAVGPAGAAIITTIDDAVVGRQNLSLIADGGVAFSVELSNDSCCESLVVGDDRVLLRTTEALDVYLLDGTLIHETLWIGAVGGWGGRWLTLPLVIVVLVVAAIGIGFASRGRTATADE